MNHLGDAGRPIITGLCRLAKEIDEMIRISWWPCRINVVFLVGSVMSLLRQWWDSDLILNTLHQNKKYIMIFRCQAHKNNGISILCWSKTNSSPNRATIELFQLEIADGWQWNDHRFRFQVNIEELTACWWLLSPNRYFQCLQLWVGPVIEARTNREHALWFVIYSPKETKT
jgi:hypothetical protein